MPCPLLVMIPHFIAAIYLSDILLAVSRFLELTKSAWGMYRYPVFQMMPLHDVHDLPDALKTGTPGECVLQYGPFLIRYRTEEA